MRLPHSASRLRWRLPETADELPPVPGVHPVVRRILSSRGIVDPGGVRDFLAAAPGPDNPFQLADMDRAVSRIRAAVRSGERIAVYGDFDADGVTATALLTEALAAIGADAIPFLPHRERDGYGVHASALEGLARRGVRLVITVDCGIRAADALAAAAEMGIDVIVTDHHLLPAELPQAQAVINPHRPDCRYGFTGLAGVGLAFKLAQALLRVERQVAASADGHGPLLNEDDLLDLVALGTVADVVPLIGENRSLVRRGLLQVHAARRPGLRALLEAAEIPPGRVTAGTLGWSIGPRLNAAGRLDDADAALSLLLTHDEDEARSLARELEDRNLRRRELTAEAVGRAEGAVDDPPPAFLFHVDADAPVGVLGLVASRLSDRFYRPAAAVRVEGELARGSLRSIPEFDVAGALDGVADLLDRHGGHAMAAGFSAPSHRLDELKARLLAAADEALSGLDLRRELVVDAAVSPEELDWALEAALEELEPFGQGNPRPLLCIRAANVAQGKVVGSDHLRFRVDAGPGRGHIGAIAFGQGSRFAELKGRVDVVANLRVGEWQGKRYLELKVADFQPA